MNNYEGIVRLQMTTTTTTMTKVQVQATDAYKAQLQLEVMYGKANIVHTPILVK